VIETLNSPIFGIVISIVTFEIGLYLYKKFKLPIFNPFIISVILIIIFLLKFKIPLEAYSKGGNFISFFLSPATVVLAVPLYKQFETLKKNAASILIGITIGSVSAIISTYILGDVFGLTKELSKSLIPRSITTPIGIEVSKQIGGIPSITVVAIIITGILGAILGPFICKIFRIKDEVAVGTAIGTASHAIGTSKAVEIGETEGAMSGLAIGISGLITVIIAPILIMFL